MVIEALEVGAAYLKGSDEAANALFALDDGDPVAGLSEAEGGREAEDSAADNADVHPI